MGSKRVSSCLFCAKPLFGTSNVIVQEKFEIIVILQEILKIGGEFSGKLLSEGGVQACGPCGEAVSSCVGTVKEISKLLEKVSSISATLRGQIYKTCVAKGNSNSDSTYGQIRLEVLKGEEARSQPNQGKRPSSDVGGTRSLEQAGASITDADIPAVNFIEIDAEEPKEVTEAVPSTLPEDHLSEDDDDNELVVVLNTEEPSTSTSSSSTVPPGSPNIYVSVPLCFADSNANSQLEKSAKLPDKVSKNDAEPMKKYICKTCKRSYDYKKNFKRHVKTNICKRPNFEGVAKVPCTYCGREILNMEEHMKICRKRKDRSSVKVKKAKPDDDNSWKQLLQVEMISNGK